MYSAMFFIFSLFDLEGEYEYRTTIDLVKQGNVYIPATNKLTSFLGDFKKKKYNVQVIVNNSLYVWKESGITVDRNTAGHYMLVLSSRPEVMNRRKHPRLAMTNSCEVVIKGTAHAAMGNVVNISAGGFAFAVRDVAFKTAIGKEVEIKINDFDLLKGEKLTGVIIRSTDDEGTYIVGCRMPEDNEEIMNYVKARMK